MRSKKRTAELLRELGATFHLQISDTTYAELETYRDLVFEWNAKTNLVGSTTDTALVEVLFADAFVLASADLFLQQGRIVDVGAGAGAPTLPLLLIRKDLSAQLIEPRRKRVAFLRVVIGTLSLQERTSVMEARVDPKTPSVLGAPFDASLSRATWSPNEWLPIGEKLAASVLVFQSHAEPPIEFAKSQRVRHIPYTLPWSNTPRVIDVYASAE